MAITGVGNYSSVYENTYALSRKETAKKEETKETAATQKNAETAKSGGNEEYLKNLQKQVPYIKLQTGYGLNTSNDSKVNVVSVNPKLLEKMQNDPQAAKEYTQRLKDVESATKWVDNFEKSMGYTAVCRHGYVDENGNFSSFAVVVRKDEMNEKLRKEAQENAEERIEKSREKARENAEKLEENAEEAKESEKSEEKKVVKEDGTTTPNKAEQLINEKMATSKEGTIYLNDTDMKTIIEAAQEEDAGKTTVKDQPQVGANLDLKI
ncbi:hypothetical protein GN277_18805 [Lachnospiraceae bacterium WCA-9-b2]|uniref:Uncharacterized protein n=1 Tax=Sporofaciens musculi TaxID=2681861 RepID=A0A7X3SKB9_9FIRM|nr:DUF6033 family protein [Sporofaciens musculi]MXP77352.1 hypothetical protein [Sporofaciens musculi]